jgi:hypothetical protein
VHQDQRRPGLHVRARGHTRVPLTRPGLAEGQCFNFVRKMQYAQELLHLACVACGTVWRAAAGIHKDICCLLRCDERNALGLWRCGTPLQIQAHTHG